MSGVGKGCCFGGIILASRNIKGSAIEEKDLRATGTKKRTEIERERGESEAKE